MSKTIIPFNVETSREFELSHWQGSGKFSRYKVFSRIDIKADFIQVSFEVTKMDLDKWNESQSAFVEYYKNWGLWNTDVVEFFLQGRDHKKQNEMPYVEFLVSPNNIRFALMTLTPRKIVFTPNDLSFESYHSVNENTWSTVMHILNPFNKSNELWGNFHACLGEKQKRQYYSAFHLEHPTPDFHRPNQFQLLGEL